MKGLIAIAEGDTNFASLGKGSDVAGCKCSYPGCTKSYSRKYRLNMRKWSMALLLMSVPKVVYPSKQTKSYFLTVTRFITLFRH